MNIALIGLRGSGKSFIGNKLAQKTGLKFVDCDSEITTKAELSIPEIVKKSGWSGFRKLEKETLSEILQKSGQVIATGGGVILDEDNIKALKENCQVIYLKCDPKICLSRIRGDKNRPALTNKNELEEMTETHKQRQHLYEKTADLTVETENSNTEKILQIIVNHLDEN